MMEIVIATGNRNKFKEITALLADLPVRITPFWDWEGATEIKEEGRTYAENALHKARTVVRVTGRWAIGDDTGLEVEFLGGAPGLYSARYAGEKATFEDNRRKLLSELKGVPWEKRNALFRSVMALAGPRGEERVSEGTIAGYITEEERGAHGFGYDPIFYWPEAGRTLAEVSAEEKNRISHRARALMKLKEQIVGYVGV
jgi:XTP/dITP diphosphohydrolase